MSINTPTESRLDYNQARNLQPTTPSPIHERSTLVNFSHVSPISQPYHIMNVTTLPHRGRVGPPPYKRVATTSNTATAKKTKPPNPPPVGKAEFEVWVLTKGGLLSVHHCRQFCTVVHVHPLDWGGTLTPRVRACIGMVRSPKANFPTIDNEASGM